MSRLIYATHVQCDGCGAHERMPSPSEDPSTVGSSPAGWLPAGVQIRDGYNTAVISDLCPACMGRPLEELLEAKLARSAEAP